MTIFYKLMSAYKNSLNGLASAWKTELSVKIEVLLLFFSIPIALYISRDGISFILLIGSILLLLMMELLNTAIETTVNRIGLEKHPLSGLAKDIASSAILVSIINMLLTWGIIVFNTATNR